MAKYNKTLLDYTDNIKITTFFNEKGEDINVIIKELILNNCVPIERKKLEL